VVALLPGVLLALPVLAVSGAPPVPGVPPAPFEVVVLLALLGAAVLSVPAAPPEPPPQPAAMPAAMIDRTIVLILTCFIRSPPDGVIAAKWIVGVAAYRGNSKDRQRIE
jgi:hypothetical protein